MAKISKTEKELQRYKSMDKHTMSFVYRGFAFLYVEESGVCKVHVHGADEAYEPFGFYDIKVVKPFGRKAFETWCICWTVDYFLSNKEETV